MILIAMKHFVGTVIVQKANMANVHIKDNFTPGPWIIRDKRYIDSPNRGKKYQAIGQVGTYGVRISKIDEANARLIAAAPETAKERDKLAVKCQELEKYIHEIRPYADCYKRVCQSVGIEKDIVGYIKKLRNSHDALLDALKQAVCGNMGWKGIAEDVIARAEKEG